MVYPHLDLDFIDSLLYYDSEYDIRLLILIPLIVVYTIIVITEHLEK